jgi:hypothetical protein
MEITAQALGPDPGGIARPSENAARPAALRPDRGSEALPMKITAQALGTDPGGIARPSENATRPVALRPDRTSVARPMEITARFGAWVDDLGSKPWRARA